MSKAKLDGENRVREYLTGANLRIERFSKAEMSLPEKKTPDFRVFSNSELAFYCEVKTAQEDEWLDRQLATAADDELVGGLRSDPICSRINSQIHRAGRQFNAVNPALDYPNVLAIVNGDRHAGFRDLVNVLGDDPMFHQYSQGRIREEKLRVHLYLWFDEWKPGDPEPFFPKVHAVHHATLCRYFNLARAAFHPLRR